MISKPASGYIIRTSRTKSIGDPFLITENFKKHLQSLLLAAALALPAVAFSAGLAPCEFGMSKAQVSGFKDYGPYRSFSNGDLETYAGLYDGRKENVQFFFKDDKLGRIGIYLYEGTDIEAARQVWKRAYQSLAKKYGKIETDGIASASNDAEALSLAAAAALKTTEKVQMAPARQPAGTSVFSSYFTKEVRGTRLYWVTVIFDPRP